MNRKRGVETAVGVFIVVGIACLAWLSMRLGKVEFGGGNRSPVSAEFASVAGLRAGGTVEIAGVEVGSIESIEVKEYKAVVLTCLLFAFSFKLSSPVHGLYSTNDFPAEVFDQDSRYIITSLVDGEPFPYNPQHHLLYHALTEWGYKVLRPHLQHRLETVYLFLKGFTLLTGIAFTIVLSRLLWEMDLRLYHRVLLLLSGISVTAWFNFSAFETHSLAMAAIALYLLVFLRLTRLGQFRLQEEIMLGVSLVFMSLCRLDLARFFVATALLIPVSPYRAHWRRLGLVLVAALLAGGLLYSSLASVYFKRPLSEASKTLVQRKDRQSLEPVLGTVHNFTAENLSRMTLATTVSTVIMPIEKRKFAGPLDGIGDHGGAMLTVALWAVIFLVAGWATWKNRENGGPLAACILMNWGIGLLLCTWFNPHEPFLWLLEFLPLLVVFLGNGLKKIGNKVWVLVSIGILFILVHNVLFFYLPYRIYG